MVTKKVRLRHCIMLEAEIVEMFTEISEETVGIAVETHDVEGTVVNNR